MIGEKLLHEPKTDIDIKIIFNDFGLYLADEDEESNYKNAKRLVELNNEVYEKLHPKCKDCGCNVRILEDSYICYDCSK